MSVEIRGSYSGQLKMTLAHGPSGAELRTAAPKDNQGDGSSFSPTDLLAAALGSCIVTTMAITAQRDGLPYDGAYFSLEKHMRSDPRRVARVPVRVHLPQALTPEQRQRLEHIGRTCPVARSLNPEVEQELEFVYDV